MLKYIFSPFLLFFLFFSSLSFAQSYPSCSGSTLPGGGSGCLSPDQVNTAYSTCGSHNPPGIIVDTGSGASCTFGVNTYTLRTLRCYPSSQCSCPQGHSLVGGVCEPPVQTPQECGITGFPIWNGSGYECSDDFNTPCPEGTTNGMYTLPGYDPRPYCADASTPNSSSAGSASSNSGQNSSSNNSDGNGDGEGSGSSSGNNNGNSSSASSTGGGANSSGSASSGQGGSASSSGGTASGGEDCNSPPVCEGDELECMQIRQLYLQRCPGTELNEVTGVEFGDSLDEATQEAIDNYNDKFNEIKGEMEDLFSIEFSGGSGGLASNVVDIKGAQVEVGIAARQDFFSYIRNILFFAFCLAAFFIIMRT